MINMCCVCVWAAYIQFTHYASRLLVWRSALLASEGMLAAWHRRTNAYINCECSFRTVRVLCNQNGVHGFCFLLSLSLFTDRMFIHLVRHGVRCRCDHYLRSHTHLNVTPYTLAERTAHWGHRYTTHTHIYTGRQLYRALIAHDRRRHLRVCVCVVCMLCAWEQ